MEHLRHLSGIDLRAGEGSFSPGDIALDEDKRGMIADTSRG
jgi:hypothetical protein